MSTASSGGTSRNGIELNGEASKNDKRKTEIERTTPLFRSRTDSLITYTPPAMAEAAGSTFYIRKNGHIDYIVLLKVRFAFH